LAAGHGKEVKMFVLKKKYLELERRVSALEEKEEERKHTSISLKLDGKNISNLLLANCDKVPKA